MCKNFSEFDDWRLVLTTQLYKNVHVHPLNTGLLTFNFWSFGNLVFQIKGSVGEHMKFLTFGISLNNLNHPNACCSWSGTKKCRLLKKSDHFWLANADEWFLRKLDNNKYFLELITYSWVCFKLAACNIQGGEPELYLLTVEERVQFRFPTLYVPWNFFGTWCTIFT